MKNNQVKDKAKTAYLVLMIVFLAIALGLSGWLTYAELMRQGANKQLENGYQQAYFELLGQTNDMEVKAAKLAVSTSDKTREQLLYEIWKGAEVSSNCLASLSPKEGSVSSAAKFYNQMGDYCLYLAKKLAAGEKLDEQAVASISKIHEMLVSLGKELAKIQTAIGEGYMFLPSLGTDADMLEQLFGKLSDGSVEYSQLIYDGPFSDSLTDKEIKFALGEAVSSEAGAEIAKGIFVGHNVTAVEFLGQWDTDISTLNYQLTIDGFAEAVSVQLTLNGGVPLQVSAYREVNDPTLTEEECSELASQELKRLGFDNMEAVWSANNDSVVYVNLAPKIDGVIYYPDLIKVKIASDSGKLIGLDAANYIYNHCDRMLPQPALSAEQAKAKVSDKAEVSGGRLVLIPKDNAEILCYEFSATLNGDYLVYIDAVSGDEANILYIIDAQNGKLLM